MYCRVPPRIEKGSRSIPEVQRADCHVEFRAVRGSWLDVFRSGAWHDFICVDNCGFPTFVVSERVHAFVRGNCSPDLVQTYPVHSLGGKRVPPYFYIVPSAGFRLTRREHRTPLVDLDSWNGECLCDADDGLDRMSPTVYCAEDFVAAYVRGKWTGASFSPIDVGSGPHVDWNGVDTDRGGWQETIRPKKTPIEVFPNQLLIYLSSNPTWDETREKEWGRYLDSQGAFIDGGQEAADFLTREFESASGVVRDRIAQLLWSLYEEGLEIPEEIVRKNLAEIEGLGE
ncbi:MAG: hypothetical protein AAF517_23990 [Planctomycetota bacterium]